MITERDIDPRFRAFLEGFEAEHIEQFLAQASVGDARRYGEVCAERIKSIAALAKREPEIRADERAKVIEVIEAERSEWSGDFRNTVDIALDAILNRMEPTNTPQGHGEGERGKYDERRN